MVVHRIGIDRFIMCKVGFLFLSCIAVCTRSFSSRPAPCSSDEAELAGKRVQTLAALDSAFRSFGASETFSLDPFLSQLSPLVIPEFSLIVPHGAGLFLGLNDAAEYLALQFSSVNVGLSIFNLSDTAGVFADLVGGWGRVHAWDNDFGQLFSDRDPFLPATAHAHGGRRHLCALQ